jgi:molybdenum cofactor biosynthesis enzyme
MHKLSHYDDAGQAHMVDVSGKAATRREGGVCGAVGGGAGGAPAKP